MFIPRKGTRRGLASRGKALVQLAALPGFIEQGATNHAVCWPITRAWHNTTGLFKTFHGPSRRVIDNAAMPLLVKRPTPSDCRWCVDGHYCSVTISQGLHQPFHEFFEQEPSLTASRPQTSVTAPALSVDIGRHLRPLARSLRQGLLPSLGSGGLGTL